MRGETIYYVTRFSGCTTVERGTDGGNATTFDGRRARSIAGLNGTLVTADNVTTRREYDRYHRYIDLNFGAGRKWMQPADDDLNAADVRSGRWNPERGELPADDVYPPCPHGVEGGAYCWDCD